MHLTVYQVKGSSGKTPIATNFALDHDYPIATNEAFHVYGDFLPEEKVLTVDLTETFPDIPEDTNVVFDLAGAISKTSHSITSAILQSDIVIVPIVNEIKSLRGGIGTLHEINNLDGFNSHIVIVATKLEKQGKEKVKKDNWSECLDFKNVERVVRSEGFNFPIFPLKYSKAFDAIFEQEKSIEQMCDSSRLTAHSFKIVRKQMNDIYTHINQLNHA